MMHPMDSAIQHLNNWGLENKLHKKRKTEENDHPFITLPRKQIFLANKLQYLKLFI